MPWKGGVSTFMEGCPCYHVLEPFPPLSGAPVLLTVLWSSSQAWQASVELVKAPKFYGLLKCANILCIVIVKQYAAESWFTLALLFTVPPTTPNHQNNFSFSEWLFGVSWYHVLGLPADPPGIVALK